MVEKQREPTVGLRTIEKDGFHKKVPVRSYAILMCEAGGSRVKAIRLDNQISVAEAISTALKDNPGWLLKRAEMLMDRDFGEDERV